MSKELFHQILFEWWREHGRVLPWREKVDLRYEALGNSTLTPIVIRERAFKEYFAGEVQRDPYRVVVAEMMLQQTQVSRVMEKYEKWMEKWPTISDFIKATLAEVVIEWQGLGYNRRARYLWLLSKEIVEDRGGVWPQNEAELLKLPGIGKYTARAILSFAFGQQVGVVDVNVKRVLGRWDYINQLHTTEKEWFSLADSMLPVGQADPWNQALMDFGALICTVNNPKCPECPFQQICAVNNLARKNGFANYAELQSYQNATVIKPEKTKKSKDWRDGRKLKFEETDRFLRGRIIDTLREKDWNTAEMIIHLSTKYTNFEPQRFEVLIQALIDEGLIQISEDLIHLAH